jgi:hypothetical protein
MIEIDFVIPLLKNNMIIRTTIESIIDSYHPKNIYIITNENDIDSLENNSTIWDKSNTNIIILNEEVFFLKNYNLTRNDIELFYTYKDEKSREFGWWYQQLLKLGAHKQIENLSDPYIVWDSDLIVLQKWDLFDLNESTYKFAILQEQARNEFNKNEYSKSIKQLIDLDAIEPDGQGTFVPHHFIFYHKVLNKFVDLIEDKTKNNDTWVKIIMSLSKTFYRFSEYKCVATFMNKYFPDLLLFYPYSSYGENGIRYRDSQDILEKIKNFLKTNETNKLTYKIFKKFIEANYKYEPSYIQIEHVIK